MINNDNYELIQQVLCLTKPSTCNRFEQLDEGKIVKVSGIKFVKFRERFRYILKLENLPGLYLSNYWLEQAIQHSKLDLNYTFSIRFLYMKLTPTNHKERYVEIMSEE